MAEDTRETGRRGVLIGLALLAAAGWMLALAFYFSRASLRSDFTSELAVIQAEQSDTLALLAAQEEASGTLEALQAELMTATSDLNRLTGERDTVQGELSAAQATLADVQGQTDARSADLAALESRLKPLNEELNSFQDRLDKIVERIAASTEELADVGARLETARTQEAEQLKIVAALSQESADRAAGAAEAEQRLQEARAAELSLQNQLEAARLEFSRMAEDRTGLEQAVADLTRRRDALASDNDTAREQRQALQQQLTELSGNLAARSEDLAALEVRIAKMQAGGAELSRSAATGVEPGRYQMGPIVAFFSSDGSFRMSEGEAGQNVTGRYVVADDVLSLEDVIGDTGAAIFPMECTIEPLPNGFRFSEQEGSCAMFSGVTFERNG